MTLLLLDAGPATPYTKSVPRHRKNLELGEKVLTFTNTVYLEQEDAKILKDNEEVRHPVWVCPFPISYDCVLTRMCVSCMSCRVVFCCNWNSSR
jgi:hypothetical protein